MTDPIVTPAAGTETKPDLDASQTKTGVDTPKQPEATGTEQPADKKADAGSEKPVADDKKEPVVPEVYEAKLPAGQSLDPEFKKEFDTIAKEAKLTQEQYQKHIEIGTKAIQKALDTQIGEFDKMVKGWKDESIKLFGAEYEKELAFTAKAIDHILTDKQEAASFREKLNESGLGNWSPMVKVLSFMGKMLAEDKTVNGRPETGVEKSAAAVLYPNLPEK